MLQALGPLWHMLGLIAPILLPIIAYAFTTEAPLWRRSILLILASLVSLPLGCALVFLGYEPAIFTRENVNPGVGIVAVPVVALWFVSFVGIVGWLIIAAVARRLAK